MKDDRLIIKKRGEDGYHTFSVRLKKDVIAQIDKITADSGRSRNEVIGILLEYATERCDIEK